MDEKFLGGELNRALGAGLHNEVMLCLQLQAHDFVYAVVFHR
jgi:hypothetical protein